MSDGRERFAFEAELWRWPGDEALMVVGMSKVDVSGAFAAALAGKAPSAGR